MVSVLSIYRAFFFNFWMRKTRLLLIVFLFINCFSCWINYRMWVQKDGYYAVLQQNISKKNLLIKKMNKLKIETQELRFKISSLSDKIDIDTLKHYNRLIFGVVDVQNDVFVVFLK